MDATSDRSTFPAEEALICYLEDDDRWRRRFPSAELCVAGSAFGGFLIISGIVMVTLHYTIEARDGFHSLLESINVNSLVFGFTLIALASAFFITVIFAYAVCKVMEIIEMAHRYKEHKELCAYEDLRQSFRSQHSMRFDTNRCVIDLAKYPIEQKENINK
ncbi:hypothetical protein X975_05760, partial [Stegodyphus mimosarum]